MSKLDLPIQIASSLPDHMMQSLPATQAIVQLRNQCMSAMLHQRIASGFKQVVILGAGPVTYADQLATPDVHYFEIGQATIVQHKLAQSLCDRSLVNTTYIAENYLQPRLIELLQRHQFDVHLPTYFVWAGSVPSLKRGDIITLIDTLRNQIHQFHLSFDYLSFQLLNHSTNDSELNQTLDCLNHLGINWNTVFKDIATFARALGLEPLETCTLAELHNRYRPRSSLPSTLLNFYCVCTIAKQVLRW